jgi:hypothetical protein
MPNDPSDLDELVSGEDEFDVDLMAASCRLVAVPGPAGTATTMAAYLRDMPGLDDVGALQMLVENLVEQQQISAGLAEN